MVYIPSDHDRLMADALTDELVMAVRTIYRYVDTLSTSGAPVYVEKGRNGGVSLLRDL